jgi:hypothetical protein
MNGMGPLGKQASDSQARLFLLQPFASPDASASPTRGCSMAQAEPSTHPFSAVSTWGCGFALVAAVVTTAHGVGVITPDESAEHVRPTPPITHNTPRATQLITLHSHKARKTTKATRIEGVWVRNCCRNGKSLRDGSSVNGATTRHVTAKAERHHHRRLAAP